MTSIALHALRRRRFGASAIEYGAVLALVALAAIGAVATTGQKVTCIISHAASAISGDTTLPCAAATAASTAPASPPKLMALSDPTQLAICAGNTDQSAAYYQPVRTSCYWYQYEPGWLSAAQVAVGSAASGNGSPYDALNYTVSAYQAYGYLECGSPSTAKNDPADYQSCANAASGANQQAIANASAGAANLPACQGAPGSSACSAASAMLQAQTLLNQINL